MSKWIFWAFASLLLSIASLVFAPHAHACSCLPPTYEGELAESSDVFEGRVESIADVPASGDAPASRNVTMSVVRTWKGAKTERIEVNTAADSAACGFNFEQGKSYLVYARTVEGKRTVGLCSRTAPVENAGEDLGKLGAGVTPYDVPSKPAAHNPATYQPRGKGGCQSCAVESASPAYLGHGYAVVLAGVWIGVRAARRRAKRSR